MGKLYYPLFFLPIYRHTENEYKKKGKAAIEKQKREFEKTSPEPFDRINHKDQIWWKERWSYPPWKFNDIVGFLDIWTDFGNRLTATIYLKRKYFPKSDNRKRRGSTIENNEFLSYGDTTSFSVMDRENNDSYLQALEKILDDCKKIFKQIKRDYILCTPSYDFNCFKFVEACRQVREKSI